MQMEWLLCWSALLQMCQKASCDCALFRSYCGRMACGRGRAMEGSEWANEVGVEYIMPERGSGSGVLVWAIPYPQASSANIGQYGLAPVILLLQA